MSDLSLCVELGNSKLWFYRGEKPYLPAGAAAYEMLETVEPIRECASTPSLSGWGEREAPSFKVTLTNKQHKLYKLMKLPFRRKCSIYNPDGTLQFSGIIASVDYGYTMTLEVGV